MSSPTKNGNGSGPDENQPDDEKSMTIFRNNYETSILAPWVEDKRKKSRRSSSASEIKRKNNNQLPNNNEIYENFETHVAWTGRIKYAVDELEQQNAQRKANKDIVFRDANRLLEITISTIILMAMHETIPDENYVYTSLYLQNIRDEFGDHPPNIAKILHLIHKVSNTIDWGTNITSNFDEQNNTLMKFNNTMTRSRIPIRSQKKSASEIQLT